MVATWFQRLNTVQFFTNENVNMLENAALALIMVLATYEAIEGLLIRDCKELRPTSVVALTLMRSHGSLRKMWALVRSCRWKNGAYHGPNCDCHLRDNTMSISATCAPSTRPINVSRRLLLTTLFVRAVIIIVEVVAIVLAINFTTEKEVPGAPQREHQFPTISGSRTN